MAPLRSTCRAQFSALWIRDLTLKFQHRMNAKINYLLLTTALLGTFFSGTATRIVSISMPTIATSLATDLLGISWALLSYQLSNIGLSIVFGRLSDLWGREKVFALGFLVFSAGSFLCGFSQSLIQLIVFRFFAGNRRCDVAVLQPGVGGGIGSGQPRWKGTGLYDNRASRGIYHRPKHRRPDDRLPELALEFFLSGADRHLRHALDFAECKAASAGFLKPLGFYRLSRRRIVIRDNQRVGDAARPAHTADDSSKLEGCVGRFVYRLPCRLDSS